MINALHLHTNDGDAHLLRRRRFPYLKVQNCYHPTAKVALFCNVAQTVMLKQGMSRQNLLTPPAHSLRGLKTVRIKYNFLFFLYGSHQEIT